MVSSSQNNSVEKAIGVPSDMDPEHKYVYFTGYHAIRSYWWKDNGGNYWRYTNAPVDHPDFDIRLGEPLIHPEQPMPTTEPEYFTDDGYKRSQAVAAELLPLRNPAYSASSPRQVWFELVQAAGLTRYIYLESDLRENLDLWTQYQLRVTDASLLTYRHRAYDLFNSAHEKDRITGTILMLVEQGFYLPEDLVDFLVSDLTFVDRTIILGGKKFVCDDALFDFFTTLTKDRMPEDPLFVLQTVHGRNSLGYNYIYSVFDALKVDPYYLIAWHVNHSFSRIMHRMAAEGIPLEEAQVKVYKELSYALSTPEDVSFFVDIKVRDTIFNNYDTAIEQPVAKAISAVPQDPYATRQVVSNMIERRPDEAEFSIWLHAEPMHDITPEEEAEIQAQAAEVVGEEGSGEQGPPSNGDSANSAQASGAGTQTDGVTAEPGNSGAQ